MRVCAFRSISPKKVQKGRNVPDYMPWDSEVVALFCFLGLCSEYHALESFEVTYMLGGQCEMHTRTGNWLVRRGDLIIIPSGAEGYWVECQTQEPPFMIPVLLPFGSAFFSMMNGDNILSAFFTAVLTGRWLTAKPQFGVSKLFHHRNI